MCAEVIQAPVALILRVFVSSTNSAPDTSMPLRKTGTCKRIRGERRVDDDSTRCPFLRISIFKWSLWLGTKELVRMLASSMPERAVGRSVKFFIICQLWVRVELNNFLTPVHCFGNPLPFLKCANGKFLPLRGGESN